MEARAGKEGGGEGIDGESPDDVQLHIKSVIARIFFKFAPKRMSGWDTPQSKNLAYKILE